MGVVANVAVNVDARDARRQLENLANTSKRTENALGGITRAVGKLALAYGSLRTAQAALQAGISRIESERRIQFLAKGYGEAAQLATAASRAAEKFGVSQTEANQALANTYARLRPVGVELQTIESIYAGFNTAARISGASAVEASNAFTQLAQALGSGALRGDEFNSISEQVPGILTAISKETGVAQGALRAYAAEGKITANVVIRALQRIEREGADQLTEALNGPQQKIKDFQNATEDVQVALTRTVIPELTRSLTELGNVILALEGPIRFIGGLLADALGAANDLIGLVAPGTSGTRKAIEAGRLPLESDLGILGRGQGSRKLFEGTITPFGVGLEGIKKEAYVMAETTGKSYSEALVASMQKYLKANDAAKKIAKAFEAGEGGPRKTMASILPPASTKGKGAKALKDDTPELIRQSEQLLKVLALQLKITEEQNPIKQIALQLDLDKLYAQQEYEDILSRETNEIVRQNAEKAKGLKIDQAAAQAKNKSAQLGEELGHDMARMFLNQKKQNQELTETEKLWGSVYQTVATNLTQAIQGLIQGTTTLNDIASQLLGQLGSLFLNAAFGGLGTALKIPGFADGGYPPVGQPSIVGERGPELFVPGQPGMIVPNDVFEATRNAIGSNGGSAAAFDENREALNSVTTLNRERQVERLLTSGASNTEIRYSRVGSGDLPFVTEENMLQATRIAAQEGARLGQARTLAALKNNPGARRSIGI